MLLPAVSFVLFGAGCATVPIRAPVTVEQVMAMSKNDTDAPRMIAKMQEAAIFPGQLEKGLANAAHIFRE
jgi:hypothetical protein